MYCDSSLSRAQFRSPIEHLSIIFSASLAVYAPNNDASLSSHPNIPPVVESTTLTTHPETRYTLLFFIRYFFATAQVSASGIFSASKLLPPLFPEKPTSIDMDVASPRPVPGTPRVISPSPDPSDASETGRENYFGTPKSRSRFASSGKVQEGKSKRDQTTEPEWRARSRSRSVDIHLRKRRTTGLTPLEEVPDKGARRKPAQLAPPNGTANGHLSPASAAKSYWRELSRSPSPLGLIPIHREWRSFVHRHEIPRKALHVSIGFLTLGFYANNYQPSDIHPYLLTLLIPITIVEFIRHHNAGFNRFYIRVLGAFMRESEAHDKYNGVIWYLLGTWTVLRFCPKDVGVMCICLLSWCDTAASTFGRLWGRYTPRIRCGKSLAGSLAACIVGISTAVMFWGWFAPKYETLGYADNTGVNAFAYQGHLGLPRQVRELLGWKTAAVSGGLALGIMSAWAGFVASASEAVDIFNFDDNVTIPILCGFGIVGFLKVFGSA